MQGPCTIVFGSKDIEGDVLAFADVVVEALALGAIAFPSPSTLGEGEDTVEGWAAELFFDLELTAKRATLASIEAYNRTGLIIRIGMVTRGGVRAVTQ
jgi:hypothetical protein